MNEKMRQTFKVVAFDADDTLWSNEPFFQEVEREYRDLLGGYGCAEEISAALLKTEMENLECLGYGAKAFTISMVETFAHPRLKQVENALELAEWLGAGNCV